MSEENLDESEEVPQQENVIEADSMLKSWKPNIFLWGAAFIFLIAMLS